ncbi:Murinoglobulin-1 [Heterocephalus glaber]|uniref:Murinoglobulin-1 n=1 Tax=Heterocephalus glaber TaxID=10181 RepID=G5BPM0_HETGA|nr:Murinoglobulin-1 [Heterocephalus glaber]
MEDFWPLHGPYLRQYMVLVPSWLHTEVPEKSCLHLCHLNETVTVSASLESSVGNRSLFSDLVIDKDLFQCVSFTIKGPTHVFRDRMAVLVKNRESAVIVQTDKPMYTPGQSVLPNFDVQVKCPKTVSFLDKEVNVTVCGIYTYGKPVRGHVKLNICRKYLVDYFFGPLYVYFSGTGTGCEEISQELDSQGCITQPVMTYVDLVDWQLAQVAVLQLNAKIIEEGTGLEFTRTGTTEVNKVRINLVLVQKDFYFRQGIPFVVQVHLEDRKGVPIANEHVFLQVYARNSYTTNATTDEHGLVEFSINTTDIKLFSFTFKIMAKGSIIQTRTHAFLIEPGELQGHFNLSIPMEPYMAPVSQMLIYAILPKGEVIADSTKFKIVNCPLSKVGLSFSSAQTLPASQAHLQVTAAPQSLCALRAAVDQSVLLLRPEAELSASSIYNLLSMMDNDFIPCLNHVANDPENCQNDEHGNFDKISYSQLCKFAKDAFGYIESMGLNTFTNLKIRNPRLCLDNTLSPIAVPVMLSHNEILVEGSEKPFTKSVRNYFPETWIWDLIVVNSSGVAEVGVTVPDTITEWKAGAFCLSSDSRLGLSPTASLRAFQSFFVEFTMPYSVVRGEAFTLKATVVNYLPDCIRVSVQLAASPDFTAVPVEKDQDSYCLCADGRQTVSWLVTPKLLGNVNFSVSAETRQSPELCGNGVATVPEAGRKDTVVKGLLVEPEGIKKEYKFNSFLCASGDILSSSIKNIQNLLQMPYGCGEQNMVLFTPNIYILKYLNETHQLTQKIKSKAISYLYSGYQRELNYKHPDGSYSAFGHQDYKNEGNIAFVLKTFVQARAFIFINETHITHALSWLFQKQKDSGCFRSSGRLFHNDLKGEVEDEVTLSAYITIALLEIPLPPTHPIVSKALICLNSTWETTKEVTNGSHVYTKALLAYAFALAGNQEKKKEILKSIDEEAVKEGEEDNSVHWERPQKPREPERYLYQPQAPSAEVEMTAYVLLAHLTAQPDTVVALHALSRYGAATFSRTGKMSSVTIQSSGTFSTKFQVENSNCPLLQQVTLPNIPGEYNINVSGEGCVYTQTALKYNALLEKEDSGFALEVQTIPQTCDGPEAHMSFQISLEFRKEVNNSNVLIYVDQVTNQTLSFAFTVVQDVPVRNLKPALVKVYDYYETAQVNNLQPLSSTCTLLSKPVFPNAKLSAAFMVAVGFLTLHDNTETHTWGAER